MFPYLHPSAREVSSVLERTNQNANALLKERLSASPMLMDRIRLALFTKGVWILLIEYATWIIVTYVTFLIMKHLGLMRTGWASLAGAVLLLSQAVILPALLAFRPSSDITSDERWVVTSLRYTGLHQNQYDFSKARLLDGIEIYQKWSTRFWNILYLVWGGVFSTFFGSTVRLPFAQMQITPESLVMAIIVGSGGAILLFMIFVLAPLHWLKSVLRYWPHEGL